jgi:hypothetical protein
MVAESNSLSSLLKRIFVSVNLRQNGTELHLQFTDYDYFAHAIAYALLLERDGVNR